MTRVLVARGTCISTCTCTGTHVGLLEHAACVVYVRRSTHHRHYIHVLLVVRSYMYMYVRCEIDLGGGKQVVGVLERARLYSSTHTFSMKRFYQFGHLQQSPRILQGAVTAGQLL